MNSLKIFNFFKMQKGGDSSSYEKLKEKYKKLSDKCSQQTDEITNLELKLSSALAENVFHIKHLLFIIFILLI